MGNVRETVVFGNQEGLTFDLDGGPIIAHLHEPAEEDRHVFDVAWRKDFGVLRDVSGCSRFCSGIHRGNANHFGVFTERKIVKA